MLNACYQVMTSAWHYATATNLNQKQKLNQRREKLSLCIQLMDEHEEAMLVIHQALDTCFADEIASIKQAKQSKKPVFFSKPDFSSVQVIQSIEARKEVLGHLLEQLAHYPELPEGELSADVLDIFYQDRVAHHHGVQSLIETYLPETYAYFYMQQNQQMQYALS